MDFKITLLDGLIERQHDIYGMTLQQGKAHVSQVKWWLQRAAEAVDLSQPARQARHRETNHKAVLLAPLSSDTVVGFGSATPTP